MGIVALITAALTAIVKLPEIFQQFLAEQIKSNQLKTIELKSKALQDAQAAMSEDDYRKAAKEIHDAIQSL